MPDDDALDDTTPDDDTIDVGAWLRKKKGDEPRKSGEQVGGGYSESATSSSHVSHEHSHTEPQHHEHETQRSSKYEAQHPAIGGDGTQRHISGGMQHGHHKGKLFHEHTSEHTSTGEAISFASVADFMKSIAPWDDKGMESRFWKWAVPIFLITLVFVFTFYLRALPVSLPAADRWAENNVYDTYRSEVEDKISRQFPNLPAENKQREVDAAFRQFLSKNKNRVEQQINYMANYFRSQFQDDTGQTYLLGIDPYYYYRQTRNLLEYGTVGTEVRDGKPFDTYKIAPVGSDIESNIHPYIGVLVYWVMSVFSDVSLMGSFIYVGALVSALSVIPAFLIGRKVGGNVGGFFAAWAVGVNQFFLSRTAGETSDTDAYTVFFPLLVIWLFLETMEQKDTRKQTYLALITAAALGLYAFSWTGWWSALYFLAAVLGIMAVHEIILGYFLENNLLARKTRAMRHVKVLVIIFIVSIAVALLLGGYRAIDKAIRGPLGFAAIKAVGTTKIWPNVLTTVAELNPASLDSVIGQLGGIFLFIVAVFGLALTLAIRSDHEYRDALIAIVASPVLYGLGYITTWLVNIMFGLGLDSYLIPSLGIYMLGLLVLFTSLDIKEGYTERNILYIILFGLWLLATLWSTSKGIRFTLLVVPALGVGFGFFCGACYTYFLQGIQSLFNVGKQGIKLAVSLAIAVVFVFMFVGPSFGSQTPVLSYAYAYQQAISPVPSVDDGWWNALTKIKDNGQRNAIITSWWDFGHWFKAIADRPVTFDGGSQNTPQAHWVGKLFLTRSENTSFGILRMLDCGGNSAFTEVNKKFGDVERSVRIVNEIIELPKEQAKKTLQHHKFSASEIDTILGYTHCTPPEGFVIASDDMIGKSGVWGHFGAWDFIRAAMVFETRKLPQREAVSILETKFNRSPEDAAALYEQITNEDPNRWIAPWPGYMGGFHPCMRQDNTILCRLRMEQSELRLTVDVRTMNATISTPRGEIHPQSITMPTKDDVITKHFDGNTLWFSVLLIPRGGGQYIAMLADQLHAGSIFSRMYFYDGHGLRCFDLFDKREHLGGGGILTYKADWNCEDKHIAYSESDLGLDVKPADTEIGAETEGAVDGVGGNASNSEGVGGAMDDTDAIDMPASELNTPIEPNTSHDSDKPVDNP